MYDRPQLYDDAFSYRDFTAEVGVGFAGRASCSCSITDNACFEQHVMH
jgi:hypothetical protein